MGSHRTKASKGIPWTDVMRPVRVRTTQHGTLKLRWLSLGDIEYLEGLLHQEHPPREFTAQFMLHQLMEPLLELHQVQHWPDRVLTRVATTWARRELDKELLPPEGMLNFTEFQQALDTYVTEQQRKTKLLVKNVIGSLEGYLSPLSSALGSFQAYPRLLEGFQTTALRMASVNLQLMIPDYLSSIQATLGNLKPFAFDVGQIVAKPWQRQLAELSHMTLPEPFLSDALFVSGLNSPLIHSPSFVFPQVEPPRRPEEIPERAEDAARRRLVGAYDTLCQLELSLKELIETKLKEMHGYHWWKRGVPEAVRLDCEQRKQQKERPLEPGHHPIHYAFVDNYKDMILKGDNWRAVFEAVFGNRIEVEAHFMQVQRVRVAIAHPRPLSDDEYLFFTASAKWLQIAINRALGKGLS